MPPPKVGKIAPAATQSPQYPYIVHRLYLCGHPEEYICIETVQDSNPPRILHTLVPPPHIVASITVRPYRQTRARCFACTASQCNSASSTQAQGERTKNGFFHVLRRERFGGAREWPIPWPDEREGQPGHLEYAYLKKVNEETEVEKGLEWHGPESYETRVGRRAKKGPAWAGEEKLMYVLQTAVDPSLAAGLGHDIFDEEGRERARSLSRSREIQSDTPDSPNRPPLETPVPSLSTPQQARIHQNTNKSPKSPKNIPQQSHRQRPTSHTPNQTEISRNRALALQALERCIPPTGERHSDTTPQPPRHRPIPTPSHIPSYISHQRPFGPTRSSGGTTLSYGDNPRQYDRSNVIQEPGVSINTIMETVYSSPLMMGERQQRRGSGRGSFGSFRSLESQRFSGRGEKQGVWKRHVG